LHRSGLCPAESISASVFHTTADMVIIDKKDVLSKEEERLKEDRERTKYWKKWGPYTAERQWATVREDYS